VDTSVDEADIGKVQVGQEAEFTVDAYPDSSFRGTVQDIYNQPLIVQNVVTYDAIIRVKNPDLKLKPGMTANIRIKNAYREKVLKLPNAALRYRPEEAPGPAAAVKTGKSRVAEVWVLRKGKEVPVAATLGLSDGSFTEVADGDLRPGERVIIEKIRRDGSPSSAGGGRSPSQRF
ncbi:MAG TPA: efflux RND transporter periplasmic adaptor subunit, partial [Candidatus Manganitrophaceae bacterium]|nr:efflux RND transporter periplasmic adaptor subunit [Candidatus Manganitrophaceae bacterium]